MSEKRKSYQTLSLESEPKNVKQGEQKFIQRTHGLHLFQL